jgi:hypothetical protein
MFSHVQPGQSAGRNARNENAIREQLRRQSMQQFQQNTPVPDAAPATSQTTVRIKNASGGDWPRFSVLRVTAPTIDPSDNLNTWQRTPVLDADEPDGTGQIAILLEPIGDGRIGRAAVSGIVPVLIDSTTADPTHALPIDSDITKMTGSTTGYPILARESGSGEKWGLVILSQSATPEPRILFKAPEGGIPPRVGLLCGSATCDKLKINADRTITDTGDNESVTNWGTSPACANGDRFGVADWIDGQYVVVAEDCSDEGSTVIPLDIPTTPIDVPAPFQTTVSPLFISVSPVEVYYDPDSAVEPDIPPPE